MKLQNCCFCFFQAFLFCFRLWSPELEECNRDGPECLIFEIWSSLDPHISSEKVRKYYHYANCPPSARRYTHEVVTVQFWCSSGWYPHISLPAAEKPRVWHPYCSLGEGPSSMICLIWDVNVYATLLRGQSKTLKKRHSVHQEWRGKLLRLSVE